MATSSVSDQLLRVRLNVRRYVRMARRHPQWMVMFATGRLLPQRALGRWLSTVPARGSAVGRSVVEAGDVVALASALERDGYCTGLTLAPEMVARLTELAATSPCYANSDRDLPFEACPGELPKSVNGVAVTVGEYLDVAGTTEVRELLDDPTILELASRYLRGEPHLVEARLWWSLARPEAPAVADLVRFGQDRFHYDLDDWRCISVFFYLTAVDEEAGPHTIVRGSHRRRRLRDQLSPFKGTTTETLRRIYGDDAIVAITGPVGSGFATDPFAFHMGRLPRHDRLMFKLELGCGFRGRGPGMAQAHRERRSL